MNMGRIKGVTCHDQNDGIHMRVLRHPAESTSLLFGKLFILGAQFTICPKEMGIIGVAIDIQLRKRIYLVCIYR